MNSLSRPLTIRSNMLTASIDYENKIIIFGGLYEDYSYCPIVEIFDPMNNKVSQIISEINFFSDFNQCAEKKL